MRRLLPALLVVALLAPASASARSAATAPTRMADAGGVKLAYRSIGTGPPIVFIMGLSGTMDGWDPRFLDAVAAQGRRVIVFDNQGMGRSRLRPEEMTIAQLADDAAALMRRLRLGRADVFAWSMGGMIGQSLAVRHPRVVRRLVLAASAPGDGKATAPTSRGVEAIQSDTSAAGTLDLLFAPHADAARRSFVAGVASRPGASPIGPRSVIDAQIRASATWLIGDDPDGAKVRRLRMPVLVAGAELDELLPVANTRHLARVIPRASRVIYPRAAHGFFYQHRRDFLRRLNRFLD